MTEAAGSISVVALFLHADVVVKSVLLLLLAASVWSWAVIIDKAVRLGAARRSVGVHETRAAAARSAEELWDSAATSRDPAGQALLAGFEEHAVQFSDNYETIGERRERVERAMRLALSGEMRRLEAHLPFLATIGSAAPFVGLFGTVWGIMRSFAGIAAAHNTSLAVVAPGIAEALFATAMGLAAAIPAVVAYNKFSVDLSRLANQVQRLIGRSGGLLVHPVET